MCVSAAPQVDYAAAGIFLNISSDGGRGSAPWWTRDDLQVAPGIEADVPVRAYSGYSGHACGVLACPRASFDLQVVPGTEADAPVRAAGRLVRGAHAGSWPAHMHGVTFVASGLCRFNALSGWQPAAGEAEQQQNPVIAYCNLPWTYRARCCTRAAGALCQGHTALPATRWGQRVCCAPAQVEDRFSPAWWFADVPQEAIAPLHDLNNVLPFLQQVQPLEIFIDPLKTFLSGHSCCKSWQGPGIPMCCYALATLGG